VAPTGHGKTEAALLPVLSRLLAEKDVLQARGRAWPAGFKALYVTPLRALNRDLMRRISSWAERLGITLGVRHGDTSASERARQARSPPDLLITTPETVQLLLYGDTLRRHLGTVRFVIVDEVHELAASERGAQLMIALERVEEVVAQPAPLRDAKAPERTCPRTPSAPPQGSFQRIGLSATVSDPAAVAGFLSGAGRAVEVVEVQAGKERRLRVVVAEPTVDDERLAASLALPPEAVAQLRVVRGLVEAHERVLVFQNTRDAAELMVSRSAVLDEEAGRPPLLELHHGSLSREHREDVEERFKDGDLRALVATSSLELGIDVGAIDHVVQVQSPRSVARMMQRLGRAGHRVGAVSEGTLVAGGAEDVLECLAVARRAAEGRLEPAPIRGAPLVVLANQLIALANEYAELRKDWTWDVITRAAPFAELDEGLFETVWTTLLDIKTLFPSDRGADRIGRSGRARRHFLGHVSLIPDERSYRVLDEAAKRTVGRVDEAFVAASLQPGALFIMAGRSWQVLEVEAEAGRVRVAPVKDLGGAPQWSGSRLPVSAGLAEEVARLRGLIAQGSHGRDAYPGDEAAWACGAAPVNAQVAQGLVVPTDTVVTLEVSRRRIVANVALGTRGNEALGRITQALLHQRLGTTVGMDHDAYRIHLHLPTDLAPADIEDLWRSLDPDTLDLLLALVLRESPLVRHHLVHVAKHFGALPPTVDPNRATRARLDALLQNLALQEETLSRLAHERMDLPAVAHFLRRLDADEVRIVAQAMGPLSRLGADEVRRLVAPPRADDALLAEVRRRIERTDVLMACVVCGHHWHDTVAGLPRRVKCRRCQGIQVACLRPWNEELVRLGPRDPAALDEPSRKARERLLRNAALVGSFGPVACRCLVARGVGPDTAARILQKCADPGQAMFWREVLQAELTFARTHAFWQ